MADDNNEDYENQADGILNEIWRIYKDETSWVDESKSKDGLDIVVSKTFPKWGKIFRLTVRNKNTSKNKEQFILSFD